MDTRNKLTKQYITMQFRVLGLPINASLGQIKQARNRLLHFYHPDKHMQASEAEKKKAENIFKIVQAAFEFLNKNYAAIEKIMQQTDVFTSPGPLSSKAHWAYQTVNSY